MPWDKIFELITTFAPLILECFKKNGRARTRENLRNPGPFQKLRLKRQLRKVDQEDQFGAVLETLKGAADSELDDLINEAHECCGVAVPE